MTMLDLIECDLKKGYYLVPTNVRYSVSRDGKVFDREKKTDVIPHVMTFKTSNVCYYQFCDELVHRLIAETFIAKPVTDKALMVNHIDGNGLNNNVDNLEWVTAQENVLHAYKTGLRFDNVQLLCKDLRNGNVKEFYSYWDCARHFNTNGANVHYHLHKKSNSNIFAGHYLLIRKDDNWPEVSEKDYANAMVDGKHSVLVIENSTKQAYVFGSIAEAADFTSVNYFTLAKRLRTAKEMRIKESVCDKWTIMFMYNAEEVFISKAIVMKSKRPDRRKERRLNGFRKPKRVLVKNTETQKDTLFDSLEEFCKLVNQKKNTVQKSILVNSGKWRHYLIEYC